MHDGLQCSDCGEPLTEQSKYCAHCGQSVLSFERMIGPMIAEMLYENLDIDGRMWLTMRTLLFKLGLLSLEYRNGKRTTYTPPLRLYLVISILFFLLISTLDFSSYGQVENTAARSDFYPKLMLVLLPIFALIVHFLIRGTYYLSNLVFAIHIRCIAYLEFAMDVC